MRRTLEEKLGQSNAVLRLLQQQLWSDRELIVHLDHPDDEAWPSMELYKGLQKAGIPIMVDASAAWDLPSLNILIDAHVIRFDATQLPESVEPLLDLAQMMGIQTLLANVSNASQVEWARQMGFDWLQGRLLR